MLFCHLWMGFPPRNPALFTRTSRPPKHLKLWQQPAPHRVAALNSQCCSLPRPKSANLLRDDICGRRTAGIDTEIAHHEFGAGTCQTVRLHSPMRAPHGDDGHFPSVAVRSLMVLLSV